MSLERPSQKEGIILRPSVRKVDVGARTQFICLRSVSNEMYLETPGSIKVDQLIDQFSD
jgi:hypothetical protein